jgi:hypothetical protein
METMDRSLRRLTYWTRNRPSRSPSPPDDDLSLSLPPSPTTPCTAPAPSLQRSPTLQSCDARLEEANRKVAQTHLTLASAFQTWAGAEARVGQSYLEVARNVLRAAHSHQRYHQRYYHDRHYDYQQQQQDAAAGQEDEALGVMLPKLCEERPEPGSAVREAAGEIVAGTATAERVAAYEAFLVLERRVVETKLDTLAARRMLLEAREVRGRRMSALSAVWEPLSFLFFPFSFFLTPVLLPCRGVGGERAFADDGF